MGDEVSTPTGDERRDYGMLNSSAAMRTPTRASKGKTDEYLVAGKTREQLSALRELIAKEEAMIAKEESAEKKAEKKGKSSREVVSSKATGDGTYQWEGVVCGSKGCRCESGKLHGPYLYIRGIRNDPKGRKSIYIPLAAVGQHPDAPARPSMGEM